MSDYYNKEGSLEPEHEASDPIKTPVRYEHIDAQDGAIYGAGHCGGSIRLQCTSAIGRHLALCINERPQLLAETLRLREEVERLRDKLEIVNLTLDDRAVLGRIVHGRLSQVREFIREALGQEVDT